MSQYDGATSGYQTAAEALSNALSAFTAAKADYDAFAAAKAQADPNLQYASADKKTAFANAKNATPATAAAAKAAADAITTALRAYYESHALAEGVTGAVIATDKITNPDATDSNNGWTWTGNKNNPKSSFSEGVTQGDWHVFAANWTEDFITFYVDGNPVGTYAKSLNEADLEQSQWPFCHDFYLILNQSVGDGSWAKAADTAFTYETQFDWVRVFQKDAATGLKGLEDANGLKDFNLDWHTLDGRRLQDKPTRPGIYIYGNRKYIIR